MTVEYYLHTRLPEAANEHRAICRVARLLERYYGKSKEKYYFVTNIDPQTNIDLALFEPADRQKKMKLTQLDGLLLGPSVIAILEYKQCDKPVRAPALNGTWHCGDHEMFAGGAPNPYAQAGFARYVWSDFYSRCCDRLFTAARARELRGAWSHLKVFVLFFPLLHPRSTLPATDRWLRVGDINRIAEYIFNSPSPLLQLSDEERLRLIEEGLNAKPWPQLAALMNDVIGYLYIHENGRPLLREALHRYDEYTIGRSSTQRYCVDPALSHVSGVHARVEVHNGQVSIYDAHTKNGTYVNNYRIPSGEPFALNPGERVFLGSRVKRNCQLWFQPHSLRTESPFKTVETQ